MLDTTYNLETYPLGRPVGFIECNDAAPPLEACSSESDFDEAFNPGRWSTPSQFYCNWQGGIRTNKKRRF